MPTYEYRCEAGHQFEHFQRMSEAPLDRCPQCDAPAERLLSAGAGLLFKGSGFYITDYRSESYRKAAAADSGGTASDGGKGAKDPGGGKSAEAGKAGATKAGGASKGAPGGDS